MVTKWQRPAMSNSGSKSPKRTLGNVTHRRSRVLFKLWIVALFVLNAQNMTVFILIDKTSTSDSINMVSPGQSTLVKKVFFSPTANMVNHLMREKGILLRVRDERQDDKWKNHFDQNGRDYMPSAFLHASMKAPNVIYNARDQGASEENPRVAYLIGSKFERDMPSFDLQNVVDCRAYYPIDAYSVFRNIKIMGNKLGTSCTPLQRMKKPEWNKEFFNKSNHCSCNYEKVSGKDLPSFLVQNRTFFDAQRLESFMCWYPGSSRGIDELIDASNAIFHRKVTQSRTKRRTKRWIEKFEQFYQGWTECGASPNVQNEKMIDALAIELPLSSIRLDFDNSYFEDLDKRQLQLLKQKLETFAHTNLPVLLLKENKGVANSTEECQEMWRGMNCDEGYYKEFVSKEYRFEDGSCIARAEGDSEVRFYLADSGNCTEIDKSSWGTPLWDTFRLEEKMNKTSASSIGEPKGENSVTLILTGDVHGNFLQPGCLHTSDKNKGKICGQGAPYLASVINTIRSVEKNVVLLDSGDAFFGSARGSDSEHMQLIADTMNLMHYDAMALGNHEPDYGSTKLRELAKMLKFPILASNVHGQEVGALNISSHITIPIGGEKSTSNLCVIGITANEEYPFANNLTVSPEIESVLKALHELSKSGKCHRRIILSHAGIGVDRLLAREIAASPNELSVDAILGGHSHDLTPSVRFLYNDNESVSNAEKEPVILHTGENGQFVGLLRITWSVASNALTNIIAEVLPLNEEHNIFPDHAFVADLERRKRAIDFSHQQKIASEKGITVQEVEHIFGQEQDICSHTCRDGDCVLGRIVTDAMQFSFEGEFRPTNRNETKKEQGTDNTYIALLESGTLRNCISRNQGFDDVLPWPNKLVAFQADGKRIRDMLQHGLSTKRSSTRGGGFLQVSGLKYNFTQDNHLISQSVCLDDAPKTNGNDAVTSELETAPFACKTALSNDTKYWIIVTDWLAAGGDGYGSLMKQVPALFETNMTIADAVDAYQASPTQLSSLSSQSSRSFVVHRGTPLEKRSSSNSGLVGFLGGAITFVITFPMYALFIRNAVSSSSSANLSWRLFDGVWIGVLATALTNGIFFTVYHSSDYLLHYPSWVRSFLAANFSAVAAAPFWVIITWQQLAVNKRDTGAVKAVRDIYKSRGVCGFFDSLPFNIIMCIFPTIRQVVYEMILEHGIIGGVGSSVAVGTAASIGSAVATILTYPIQKSRIIWQKSPELAVYEARYGCHSALKCDFFNVYESFFSGVWYKLGDTCIKNFLLFFVMEEIKNVFN